MTRRVNERIWAELEGGGNKYDVELDLTVMELYGTGPMPDDRAIERYALAPSSQSVAPDGSYTLRYSFNGRKEEVPVRIQGGHLLSGR